MATPSSSAPALGRRERKKQETRSRIERVGLELIARDGFKKTTVARIAEAADVAESTFFLHFATKEDLVFAGHTEEAERLIALFSERREPTLAVLRAYLEDLSSPQNWDADLWALRLAAVSNDPDLREQERARWADRIRSVLVESFAADFAERSPYVRSRTIAAMVVAGLVELGRIEAEDENARSARWKRANTRKLLDDIALLAGA